MEKFRNKDAKNKGKNFYSSCNLSIRLDVNLICDKGKESSLDCLIKREKTLQPSPVFPLPSLAEERKKGNKSEIK